MTFYALILYSNDKTEFTKYKIRQFFSFYFHSMFKLELIFMFILFVFISYIQDASFASLDLQKTHYYSIHVPCQKYDGIIKYLSLFQSISLWYSIIVLTYVAFSWCEIRFWRLTSSFYFMLATDTVMWLKNEFLYNHNISRY